MLTKLSFAMMAASSAALLQTFTPSGPNASTYAYISNGSVTVPEPMPYTPAGGFGTNGSYPLYHPLSDFDYESLSLALYQELIELDLFHYGLAAFSAEEFEAAGLNAADRYLIEFMADQEVGHATLIRNMLGVSAPQPCVYKYPFTTVKGFLDFTQKLTRFGESGVYGFLEHLDSRASAQLLLQSITTEARQQMIFRQFDGLFPMPVWFEAGITQSMAWTLLAPYIVSCPASNLGANKLAWQNFPALNVTNNPSVVPPQNTTQVYGAAITPAQNRTTPISGPGRNVTFTFEAPGRPVGPNGSYITATSAGLPAYIAWVSQLNVTFSPFTATGNNSGYTIQPNDTVFPAYFGQAPLSNITTNLGSQPNNNAATDGIINGTMFVALVDAATPALNLSAFNLSMINSHIVAGPAIYQAY
ncbi:Protein rds1 [Taphrina deformans PYCC 5710]|uniref:Protein rds1 n=1 Tax=Taphrina deformans (strain PYCC 5710 / ATCC 11124 / CBS 356.35 / IMI 108563 / JCM 9778 / NBRC 8474) TaxID=1097556 RepID=R4X7K3_TAPDE|nr:Protein rds1 [Taphrina deformans PYCC 5710]|eukprot:CCG81380.1 Protein rds1 [Taphrina deformans PYCC 5710]